MEVKIRQGNEMLDATIEMVEGVMVVSPKVEKFEPKDGDVIFVRSLYKHILIYKESKKGFLYSFVDLIDDLLDIDKSSVCREDDIEEIRPATEEEKNRLFDKLKEEGWEWKTDTKDLVKIKWEPKVDETFYYPNYVEYMFHACDYAHDSQEGLDSDDDIKKGWCFKTKEECQKFCERLNNALNQVKP